MKLEFELTKYFVAHDETTDMYCVMSAFDIPCKSLSEWYTLEDAIKAAQTEEAIWEAKRNVEFAKFRLDE